MNESMSEPLTTIERNFVEHWSKRRTQALRQLLASGTIGFGGPMSALALFEEYGGGTLSFGRAVFEIAAGLVAGAVFGAAMWGISEFRFRRLSGKSDQVAP